MLKLKNVLVLLVFATSMINAMELELHDAVTSNPLTNIKVELIKSNSIQCITEPCPSNELTYVVTTNQAGRVSITQKRFTQDFSQVTLKVNGYHALNASSIKEGKAYLRPTSIGKDYRSVTFIDAQTNLPLQHETVWFSTQKNCTRSNCFGANFKGLIFKAKTNQLGTIYYKFLQLFPKGKAQTEPVYLHVKGRLPHEKHHHHNSTIKLYHSNQ